MHTKNTTQKIKQNQTPIQYRNFQTVNNQYYSHQNQSIYYQLSTKSSQYNSDRLSKRQSTTTHENPFIQEYDSMENSSRVKDRQLTQINKKLSKACMKIQQLSNRSISKQKSAHQKSRSKCPHKVQDIQHFNNTKCVHKYSKQANFQTHLKLQDQRTVGRFYQPEQQFLQKKKTKGLSQSYYDIGGNPYRRDHSISQQNKQNQNCYSNFAYQIKKPQPQPTERQPKSRIIQLTDQKQLLYIEMKKSINTKNILIRSLEDKIQQMKGQYLSAQKQFLKKQSKLLKQLNQLQDNYEALQKQCQIYICQIESFRSLENSSTNNFSNSIKGHNADVLTRNQKSAQIKKLQKTLKQILELCLNWTNLMQRAKQQQLPATAFMVREDLMLKKDSFRSLYNQIGSKYYSNGEQIYQCNNLNNLNNQNESLLLKNSYLQDQNPSNKCQQNLLKSSSIDAIRQSLSKKTKKSSKQSLKKNTTNNTNNNFSKSKSKAKQLSLCKSKSRKQKQTNQKINTVNSDYNSQIKYTQNQTLMLVQNQNALQYVKKQLFCLQKERPTFSITNIINSQQFSIDQMYRVLLIQAHQIQQNTFLNKKKEGHQMQMQIMQIYE